MLLSATGHTPSPRPPTSPVRPLCTQNSGARETPITTAPRRQEKRVRLRTYAGGGDEGHEGTQHNTGSGGAHFLEVAKARTPPNRIRSIKPFIKHTKLAGGGSTHCPGVGPGKSAVQRVPSHAHPGLRDSGCEGGGAGAKAAAVGGRRSILRHTLPHVTRLGRCAPLPLQRWRRVLATAPVPHPALASERHSASPGHSRRAPEIQQCKRSAPATPARMCCAWVRAHHGVEATATPRARPDRCRPQQCRLPSSDGPPRFASAEGAPAPVIPRAAPRW